MTTTIPPQLFTVEEAAALARVSVRTIQYAVRARRIGSFSVGSGHRFTREQIDAYRASRKPSPERVVYVYVVGLRGASTPIKVGVASNVEIRLSTLQVGNHLELELKYAHECSGQAVAEKLERRIHQLLQKQHLRGEWFTVEASAVAAALQELAP